MVHGFAQCQDVFFEAALQFALNGYYVYLVDLEGFGFTGGTRVNRLTIDKFHHQINTLLE
jgi:pimeloyl-ACP methyl ester carboxylesterase